MAKFGLISFNIIFLVSSFASSTFVSNEYTISYHYKQNVGALMVYINPHIMHGLTVDINPHIMHGLMVDI